MNRRKWLLAIPIAIIAFLKWLAGESFAGPIVTSATADMAVPSIDSTDNSTINDVIGNKDDDHDGNSLVSITHTIEEHMHHGAKCYPTLAGGVAVLGGAGWVLGEFIEIVPAAAIGSDFDIHYIVVEAVSAADVYEIVLYNDTTEIGRVRAAFLDIANSLTLPSVPFQCAIQAADSKIQAKVTSSSGGDTITISLYYHTY